MNAFERIIAVFTNPFFKRLPDLDTIDVTGTVKSDHPKIGNGWMKGWVLNVKPRNIVIVCKHANPSTVAPNNTVFVTDSKGKKFIRTIVAIDQNAFKITTDGKNPALATPGDYDYYNGGDIAICRLDAPLPLHIAAYDIATDPDNYAQKVVTFDQDGNPSIAQIRNTEDVAWIRGKKRFNNLLIGGDSGMPWFVWENKQWKVLTHTHRGQWGEGPWYGHPFIYEDFLARVKKLQKIK